MKIAIEGCAHGELDNIYATIKEIEDKENIKIDLLICCGDFQASRNEEDLNCMAVPPKYRHICSFYKYYSGEKKAPILTIFIGGNHEASNYLQELPYGGWVANNIYYLGYASVINIADIRIGGISGIYKGRDFLKGRFEKPPYDENTKRSVYHIRNLEIFRLKQISQPIDIFLSHDWPTGVYNFGNVQQLLKRKPFFKDEIEANQLGSKPCEELLNHLQPKYWFAAHLHCKFAALVPHNDHKSTKFLALDKCLPRRNFLQVVDIPHDEDKKIQISYDVEWLTILHLTNHLLNVKHVNTYMPGPGGNERFNFTPSEAEKSLILNKLNNTSKIPRNFRPTAMPFQPGSLKKKANHQPEAKLNPQTVELCELLGIDDPLCLISESNGLNLSLDTSFLENTTFISDSDGSDSLDECESKVESDISVQETKIKELQLPESKLVTPLKLPKPINEEATTDPKLDYQTKCDAVSELNSTVNKDMSQSSNVNSSISDSINPAVGNEVSDENSAKTVNANLTEENLNVSFIKDKSHSSKKTESAHLEISITATIEKSYKKSVTQTENLSDNNISITDDKELKTSPKRTLKDETLDNSEKCESASNDLESDASEVKSSTPTPKKFKRRNADIYSSES